MHKAWFLIAVWVTPLWLDAESFVKNDEDRARIENALPERAIVQPARARRLLIFTRNVGYGGHASIAYANEAFSLMGRKTGAFETEVSDDPAVFEAASLKRFDAVFFNNTVGNCFTNRALRKNLLEFVTGGGGLLGVHGTTVAFTQWPGAIEDWPEFGFMIGARGANHKDSTEHIWIKVEDPAHPLTRMFNPDGFEYRDEFFRPQDPYSRNRVRVLLSIDTSRTDVNAGQPRGNCFRADNDYALAWIRNYGRGRMFYTTIAHNPYVFWDPKMLQFYLAALQFALGDLPASTTPSGKLTPAVRARETLGWRMSLSGSAASGVTLAEAAESAGKLGLCCVNSSSEQLISKELPKPLVPQLTEEELIQVRTNLETAGVRLLGYSVEQQPADDSGWRTLFQFGRKLGIELFVAEPRKDSLPLIEKLCDEYGMDFALWPGEKYPLPADVARLCEGRGRRIGAYAALARWKSAGPVPRQAIRMLGEHLRVIDLRHLAKPDIASCLAEVSRLRTTSILLNVEEEKPADAGLAQTREAIETVNTISLRLKH
jgi:type 1 glutamine amidotransferase